MAPRRRAAHWSFAELLRALAALPGLLRIRYTTSHPRDMHDDLIAAHRDLPALMPFLHLPVQSGSDRVLAAMNRKHGAADYLRLVDRLRAARPDIALSSDFIVGHPGETDADFQATLDLVRRVGFAQAFSFKYSPRPGTPAAGAPGQVPRRGEGRAGCRSCWRCCATSRRPSICGSEGLTVPVLFTGPGRKPGQLSGRSPYLQPVHVPAPLAMIGSEVPVRIARGHPNSLLAPSNRRKCSLEHDRRHPGYRIHHPPWEGGHPAVRRQRAVTAACSAIMTATSSGSSRGWACACRRAATGSRSPASRTACRRPSRR